jgi:macrolide transport system ATP-binding/permease protein
MAWLQTIARRLQTLFRRERFAKELDKEIQFHLDQQISELVASGMTPQDARRAALKSFGSGVAVKETAWETWGWSWLEQLTQDARFAFRQLRKTPGFTATAILTLALGIGANAAIFTLVNAVMMRNLPVVDPATLVRVGDTDSCCVNEGAPENGDYALFSTEVYERLKKNVPEFEELAAMQAGFEWRPVVSRRDGTGEVARSVAGEFVSGNYFHTFGLNPAAGRLFTDQDNTKGAPMVAVMSYQAWKNNYNSDPAIVGSTFWINTKAVTIAGIAPQGFYGDRLISVPPELYLPIQTMPVIAGASYVDDPNTEWLYIIGRLNPATPRGPLQQKITVLVKQWLGETRSWSSARNKTILEKIHVVLAPGGAGIQHIKEEYATNLRYLMAASGLVLLIACANIANLLLVRGMRRKVELSVRTALGAARQRIVRQLLTESIILAGLGGIAGLALAYLGTQTLLKLAFPGAQGMPIDAHPSLPVLAFAFGLSVLTGILFGVAPAWVASRTDPADALRSGNRGTTMGASILQRSLVVVQAALSLVLLVGAGLFTQSLNKLQHTDLKLDSKNRYIIHFNPQGAGYTTPQVEALYRTIEQRFHELPGIVNVGIASYTAMEDNNSAGGVQVQGQPDLDRSASYVKANAEYFDSVGTHVVMGRGISVQDTPAAPTVAVVNQTFVNTFIPKGENPIGRHFGSASPETVGDFQIVGVVEDTVYCSVWWKDHAMFFIPMMQRPASDKDPIEKDMGLYAGAIVVQTQRPMNDMEQLSRKTLAEINPNLAVVKFQTFDDQISDLFHGERMVAQLTELFSALALLLATIGLYGVTSYTVARRTSEIGIRMALGAGPSRVIAMVMRGALSQTVIGLAIGIPVALLCARFLATQLYEVKGIDTAVLATSVIALAIASALAGLIPARRAASTDPAQTLRTE